jgi:FAD:protein FMN transferase
VTASVRFAAIGTTVHLLVTKPAVLPVAEPILRTFIADLDLACSRFRDDSALSLLNRTGKATDPLLAEAVQVALQAAKDTNGLVDPALGTYLITLGYDKTFAKVARRAPATVDIDPPVRQVWRDIRVDGDTVTVPNGVQVDLGATAKAWAADKAAQMIAEETGAGVLVNLGGDIALAGQGPADGWSVRVSADHNDDADGGQVISIESGGLATSSVTVRSWRRGDRFLHHILDPKTGLPASRIWRYASVSALSCVAANTASTAALVLGDRAPNWLAARRLPARLVATGGAVTTVAEWPEETS